jgi:hypothetical protein
VGGKNRPPKSPQTSDPANRLIFRHFDACGTDWFPAPCEDSESVAAMRYCVVDKADIPNMAITGLHEITGLHGHVRFHSGNNPLKDAPPPVPDRVSW